MRGIGSALAEPALLERWQPPEDIYIRYFRETL